MVEPRKLVDLCQKWMKRLGKLFLAVLLGEGLRTKVELLNTVFDAVEFPMALLFVTYEGAGGEDVGFETSFVGFGDRVEGVLSDGELTEYLGPGETVIFGVDESIAGEGFGDGGNDGGGDVGEILTGDEGEVEGGKGSPFEVGFAGGRGWDPGRKGWRGGNWHCCVCVQSG